MNKITRKFLAILLSCMLVVAGVATPAKTTDNAVIAAENVAKTGTVTMTVERITIGQGYLVRPVQVEIQNGDTVDTVFKRVWMQRDLSTMTMDTLQALKMQIQAR